MTASALLVNLYPPAVRERWGTEIRREVIEGGVRSWPACLPILGRVTATGNARFE